MSQRIAPNKIDEVARTINEHPDINAMDENQRGRIVDITAQRLNGGSDGPWGRKARRADGSDKNTDALTYLRPDGDFEIYDVISGADGRATWSEYGPFKQGENGYWAPPEGKTRPPTSTHKYNGGGNDTNVCDTCGKSRFDPIHVIKDSLVTHAYDGGEHDTGVCDVCQKPKDDSIHRANDGHANETTTLLRQILDSNRRQEQMLEQIRNALIRPV